MKETPLAFAAHDHTACSDAALATARATCAARGLRLTPMRERVLRILLEEHKAMGAYDILGRLQASGATAQPPVAYRALNFLTENGFAHRIERLNAFVACASPQDAHDAAFMICRKCETVAETPREPRSGALGKAAREAGFTIERTVVEAEGICPSCAKGD